jgi:cell wall-associated NlpC family hydrolase
VALPATASAVPFVGKRSLRSGMSGKDVRVTQVLLTKLGNVIHVDGQYGRRTRQAVRRFERAHHLRADGRLTRHEQALLYHAAKRAVAAQRADRRQAPAPQPSAAVDAAPAPEALATGTGGVVPGEFPTGVVPGSQAKLNADGTATAPADAPEAVREIIAAGNRIASKPYVYGGGPGNWRDRGFDCSGSVSYALHGAGLLRQALPSGSFERWGDPGPGQWVTIYANGGHMFMVVAGLRFDTSGANPSRWQSDMRSAKGYVVRHPTGL